MISLKSGDFLPHIVFIMILILMTDCHWLMIAAITCRNIQIFTATEFCSLSLCKREITEFVVQILVGNAVDLVLYQITSAPCCPSKVEHWFLPLSKANGQRKYRTEDA